jgi:hypothetical protein
MTLLKNILSQEALNTRHAIQKESPDDNSLLEKADKNLETYDKECCPVCWIRDSEKSSLEIEKNVSDNSEGRSDRCKCSRCEFVREFLVQ